MPLIRRCRITLALEHMSKMTSTVGAHNLGSSHSKSAISVTLDSTRYAVEVCWPAAARLELVVRLVEWRITAGAGVDTVVWLVLVVFTSSWRLGALLS